MDTKKLRQKILDLAIHGKLVPQDPNDEPASVLLERIKAEKERLIKEGKIKRSKKSAKTSDTPHYENVPFEVPEGWVWTTLGSVCNFENGFAFSSDDYKKTGVPLIRISNISDNTIDLNGCVFIQKEIDDRFVVKKGDLLIALSGATTGKMGVYSTDKVAYLNQRVGNLRTIDTSVLCHEYRNIFMNSRTEAILKLAYGGAQPNISGSVICSFSFPLPPLAEQQRIASEVNHWFALIDQIEQGKSDLQTIIKQAKSKILNLAIHGKLVPQDPNDEPAIELLKRINPDFTPCDNGHYTQLPFEAPQNWSWTTLGKIGKWQSGSTPNRLNKDYYNGNIPWLKTGDLNNGYITHIPESITEKALNETSVKLNPTGSVLIAMYGATIGKIGILTFPATTNQACCACEVFNGIDKEFLFLFLLSHREEFIKMGGGGAQPNISKEKIINTYIPLPPFAEQKRIVNTVNVLFTKLDDIMESL